MGRKGTETDYIGTVITAVGVAGLAMVAVGGSYMSYQMGRVYTSNRAAMHDAGFQARAYQAGYRIEDHTGQGGSVIIARCARSNGHVPLPCDPVPRPDGPAGDALIVVP